MIEFQMERQMECQIECQNIIYICSGRMSLGWGSLEELFPVPVNLKSTSW